MAGQRSGPDTTNKEGSAAVKKASGGGRKRKSDATNDASNSDTVGGTQTTSAPPKAKKARTTKAAAAVDGGGEKKTTRAKKKPETAAEKKAAAEAYLDVSGIELPGEAEGKVPVYETCKTMRAKIRAALKKDGVTKAGFARAIGEKTADRMSRFLEKKKVMSQNTNPVYYNSYVLFEKMRIRDGQAKSKFRLEMEEVHGAKGADTEVNFDGNFWMHESETMHIDEYGVMEFSKSY